MDIRSIKRKYHESILNWYSFRRNSSFLEICKKEDSIISLLERKAKTFDSIYFDDLDNDDIENMLSGIKKKYDYIIVQELFEVCSSPSKMISRVMDILAKNGTLLATFNNRYGLKYFCGTPDPYSGVIYDGINNYLKASREADKNSNENKIKGYCNSKSEIEALYDSIGDVKYKFYYPLPDGSMPQMIMTDDYDMVKDVAERYVDYTYTESHFGVSHRIVKDVIKSGNIGFLANTFIVEATRTGKLSDVVYAVSTTDRGEDYGMSTCVLSGADKLLVEKRALWENGNKQLHFLYNNMQKLKACGVPVIDAWFLEDDMGQYLAMPYIQSISLDDYLKGIVKKDTDQFLKIFDKIYDYIKLSRDDESGLTFIDLAPCNGFYDEDKDDVIFYDQEFVLDNVSSEFSIYRTIKYFYASARDVEQFFPEKKLRERYGISESDIEGFEKIESEFLESVRKMNDNKAVFEAAIPDYDMIYENMRKVTGLFVNDNDQEEDQKKYHIGYVPGVFDLLHVGHLNLLEKCKSRCEYLIVGVLTDELVEYYKGRSTVIPYEERARLIEALKVVDEVIPVDFSNTDKLDAWEQLHYDCHFSGDDHVNHWNDILEELKKRGSNMEFFPYTQGISTTMIREKIGK